MLNQSGNLLLSNLKLFIRNSNRIQLYSAYIKTNVIEKINMINNIDFIIVRWEIVDLVNGISDLEVYNYCKSNKIKLLRNTRIHLKKLKNNK